MVSIAPRYDIRIVDAVQALDEDGLPIAEVNRRVGTVAEALGLPRPSYVHLRRYVILERERRDNIKVRREKLREIFLDVYLDAMNSKVIDAYVVAERVREAGR